MQDDQLVGDYGLDSPRIIRSVGYLAGGFMALAVAWAIVGVVSLMVLAFLASALAAFVALVLVRSSRVGKLRERVALVDRLGLVGHEAVLDVGCGSGVLLVEVARRLPDGLAVGIDTWREQDVSVSDPHATQHNAELEGVDDLVEVQIADARRMPFGDGSFDAVVSRMALHNIGGPEGRVQAIREIDRVLKPGGKVILADTTRTTDYVHALRACNWMAVSRSKPSWRLVPPVRYVEGTKPEPGSPAATPDAMLEVTDAELPTETVEAATPEESATAEVAAESETAITPGADEPAESDHDSDEPEAPEEKPEVPVV